MGLFSSVHNVAFLFHDHALTRRRPIGAWWRFFNWQLRSRISAGPHVVPFIGKTRLSVTRGMTGATGNIYCGLHEFVGMGFLLHFLRAEDLFVDVGANVGSYTVLASGVVGARTIAFEPAPGTFRSLQENVRVNNLQSLVDARPVACGREAGTVRFTTSQDTRNHVLSAAESPTDAVEVPVVPLDDALGGAVPIFMKVDVEGFEAEFVAGAPRTLSDPRLQAVQIETLDIGARYGQSGDAVHQRLLACGLQPVRYDPMKRHLRPTSPDDDARHNSMYVRDLEAVRGRIQSAPRQKVVGVEF